MDTYSSWFYSKVADPRMLQIAYFSAEYGLHHSLPFYAGGLGFLAGDFLKECSDLGVPVVGVGFMYPEGYLHQKLSTDGWQMGESEMLDREKAPICHVLDKNGQPLVIKVPIAELPVYFEVWKAQVGRVTLYLMDTDIEGNDPWNRGMSARLYIGDPEQRLVQEIILGIGGTQILNALGIKHSILHLNEGHSAFAILERIREKVEKGLNFRDASEQVKATTSLHHPHASPGRPRCFPFGLMDKYFDSYIPLLELDRDSFFALGVNPKDPTAGFNMTAFALRMSAYCNCVSKKHEEITERCGSTSGLNFRRIRFPSITLPTECTFDLDRFLRTSALFNKYLGPNWLEDHDNQSIWQLVDDIPDIELWKTHRLLKMIMIAYIQERARQRWLEDQAYPNIIMASGIMLDPNALTIGFARRFATYKRATLILQDTED